jgi:hypothetical protein
LSLETEAALRFQEEMNDNHSNFEVSIREKHRPFLDHAAKNKDLRADARAAAYVAVGLFQRNKRKQEKEARERIEREDKHEDEISRYEETAFYIRSLDLGPSASAHCYIAECRLEEGSISEARAHVHYALSISPEHALAKRLASQIGPR